MANTVVGKFRLVGDNIANLDDTDRVRIYDQVETLKELDIPAGYVLLMQPVYPELEFGPNGTQEYRDPQHGNIKFTGGTWSGPADHDLLPALMKSCPEIIELRPATTSKTYICPECDQEFDSAAKVKAHEKAAHKAASA